MCLAIGKLGKLPFQSMSLGLSHTEWVNLIKYLGVTLCGGKSLRFESNNVKQNFFAACNCVYAHVKYLDEIIHVSLQQSYCLPILTYASAAVTYSAKQVDEISK
jgi:hypothetical protein